MRWWARSSGRRKFISLGALPPAADPLLLCSHQKRDIEEGADIVMIKPALLYLDVISEAARLAPDHPIACYQVSGEYAMIHAAAAIGVFDLKTMATEAVEGMVRAGNVPLDPINLRFHADPIVLSQVPRLYCPTSPRTSWSGWTSKQKQLASPICTGIVKIRESSPSRLRTQSIYTGNHLTYPTTET